MDLYILLSKHLEGLKKNPDGTWNARCPACALENHDSQKNHLRIWPSGAFRCCKIAKENCNSEPIDHNRIIREFLYKDADPDIISSLNIQIIDPDPKLDIDKIYPDEMLKKLIPDYTYWKNRGINEDILSELQGGLAPSDERGKLSNRFVFPIKDSKNRITGWTGRLVNNNNFGPKHKHLVRSSRTIYPIHINGEYIKKARKVCFTEGIGDGLTWSSHGLKLWFLLFGLNMNAVILGFLASINPTHIIISTNNDSLRKSNSNNAGNKAAEKIRRNLIPFFGEDRIIIRLPQTGKDWNEADPREVEDFKNWVINL